MFLAEYNNIEIDRWSMLHAHTQRETPRSLIRCCFQAACWPIYIYIMQANKRRNLPQAIYFYHAAHSTIRPNLQEL